MLIRNLNILHPHPVSLGKRQSMTSILPRQINRKERLLALVVIALPQPVAVRGIRTREHGLDKLMEPVASKPGLLGQRMALRQRLDHVQDERVADDLESRRAAVGLAAEVDDSAAHDARCERLHFLDLLGRAREQADQLAVICHCGRAEDGAGDELGAGARNGLRELVGRVGVHGRAVDEELSFDVAGLEGAVDGFFDRFVVADAGEDYVGFVDGFFDARGYFGLP